MRIAIIYKSEEYRNKLINKFSSNPHCRSEKALDGTYKVIGPENIYDFIHYNTNLACIRGFKFSFTIIEPNTEESMSIEMRNLLFANTYMGFSCEFENGTLLKGINYGEVFN